MIFDKPSVFLQKFLHERKKRKVVEKIRFVRKGEKSSLITSEGKSSPNTYYNNRTMDEYSHGYLGILKSLEEAAKLGNGIFLDVGAGLTIAANQIKNFFNNKYPNGGLSFKATTLTMFDDIDKHLGKENTIITGAEILSGIAPQSVSFVSAFYSIMYSESPEMVVDKFDEVLKPGGIIKIKIPLDNARSVMGSIQAGFPDIYGWKTFEKYFKQKGYDYCFVDNNEQHNLSITLVKPGGKSGVTARELVLGDFNSMDPKHNPNNLKLFSLDNEPGYLLV